jgi:hypothetical protein
MAQPQRQTLHKVLRIGIVQDGKIVQERLIKANESVTVGESTKNTFVFPPTSLPKRFQLFQAKKGGGYILHFTEGMVGKVSYKNAIVPLDELKQKGDAVRKGTDYVLPLSDGNRGKVSVDGITVLFQFVPPPPEPMRAGKQMDFRPRLIDEDDPVYYGFLGLFTALAAVFMIYVYTTEPVERVSLEEIPDRFTNIIMEDDSPPEDIPEPDVDPDAEGLEVEKAEKDAEPKEDTPEEATEKAEKKELSPEEKAAQEAARQKANEERVLNESKLLMAIIGTRGESGSGDQVEDLFSSGDSIGQDLDSALATVNGAEVATSDGLATKAGSGTGTRGDADIGDLKGAKTGDVGVGGGVATKVSGDIALGKGDTMLEEGDTDAVLKVVRKYSGQVKYCYEAQLKSEPSLSGRVEVSWTISKGRAMNPTVFANSTGSDALGKCIVGKIRTWRFPAEVSGDVIFPFVLTPSG